MVKQFRTSGVVALGSLLLMPLGAWADSQSFQNGVAPTSAYAGSRDTKIKSDATGNHGTETNLEIDGSPDYSVLLKWDIASIPSGSTVTAASIVVNATDAGGTYKIYEMKRDWTETGATWAQYASGLSWQTAGASGANDRGTTSLGNFGGASGVRTFALNATGVALVQRWVNTPATNFGVIVQDYALSDGFDFNSREIATATNRPKLVVTYTPASGPTPTPTATEATTATVTPGGPTPTPTATPAPTATPTPTPVFSAVTICFMGDSGVGGNASATHNTCIAGGADAIVHTGDLDYQNSPTNWENFINSKVG